MILRENIAKVANVKNVGLLKGCLSNKPTIIVSAGPSLIKEETLKQLSETNRKSFNLAIYILA